MNAWLDSLAQLITTSGWLAPAVALLAGVLTSFTPCALSSVPLVIGYVGGTGQRDPGRALRLSLVFALGSAITFTALGVAASLAGRLIGFTASWWYLVLGALMVLMALQTWGIIQLIPASYLISRNKRRGYVGALIAGILGGVFSSPCATPVLVALLAILAGRGSIAWGAVLMLFYAIGHGILAVVAGTSVGLANKLSSKGGGLPAVINAILGALMLAMGLYMFYLGF